MKFAARYNLAFSISDFIMIRRIVCNFLITREYKKFAS